MSGLLLVAFFLLGGILAGVRADRSRDGCALATGDGKDATAPADSIGSGFALPFG